MSLIAACTLAFASAGSAGETHAPISGGMLAKMGLGDAQQLSDEAGMQIRGKAVYAWNILIIRQNNNSGDIRNKVKQDIRVVIRRR